MSAKKRKTRNELLELMEKFERNMQKIVDDGEITSISISSPSFEVIIAEKQKPCPNCKDKSDLRNK